MQSTERWEAVVGYEGLYEVSDLGNVRGVDRVIYDSVRKCSRLWRGRIMRQAALPKTGHLYVGLCRDGKAVSKYVHRLVLEAFVGPAPADHEALHGDGDSSNNSLGNLRWGTRTENVHDAMRHGTHLGSRRVSREGPGGTRTTADH